MEKRTPAVLQRCPKASRVVTALAGVVNDVGGVTSNQGHLKGVERQLGPNVVGHA